MYIYYYIVYNNTPLRALVTNYISVRYQIVQCTKGNFRCTKGNFRCTKGNFRCTKGNFSAKNIPFGAQKVTSVQKIYLSVHKR